jgi:hypothetical protein
MGPLGILELINGHSPSHQLTAENTDYEKHAACGDRATSLKIQLRSASGSRSPPRIAHILCAGAKRGQAYP